MFSNQLKSVRMLYRTTPLPLKVKIFSCGDKMRKNEDDIFAPVFIYPVISVMLVGAICEIDTFHSFLTDKFIYLLINSGIQADQAAVSLTVSFVLFAYVALFFIIFIHIVTKKQKEKTWK